MSQPPDYLTPEFVLGLIDDVNVIEKALRTDSSPFNRRALIRTFFAAAEGIIFAIKQTALNAYAEGSVTFTPAELATLRDEKYTIDRKATAFTSPLFIRTEENLVFAIDMALRRYGKRFPLPKSDPGWSAFKSSLALRHRLTHPKSLGDLAISDKEMASLAIAIRWFDRVSDLVLDCEIERIQKAREDLRRLTEEGNGGA